MSTTKQILRRGLWYVRPAENSCYWTVECPVCHAPTTINRSILNEIDAGTKVKCHNCEVRERNGRRKEGRE